MPKGGTVTFEIEPFAVIEAVSWLLSYDPHGAHASSLLIPPVSHEEEEANRIDWQRRVGAACRPLVKWLKRGKRYQKPNEKTALCLDRELAKWLGKYAPARNGGLFGGAARNAPSLKAPKPPAAAYFFTKCRAASSRRMGRPRLSQADVERRVQNIGKLADTTAWRMLKLSEKRLPSIEELLASYSQKTPDFLE